MIGKIGKNIGPGTLVAAAFIGPGTVTVCSLAGVTYGFTLLWAMGLSIIATLVLQEMSMRLGLVTQKGLAKNVREHIQLPQLRWLAVLLIVSAILIGNAAYEAGNISGGVLGLETLFPNARWHWNDYSGSYLSLMIGAVAFVLLFIGNYKILERALVALVLIMSLAFLITAVLTKPNLYEVLQGLFVPNVPEEGWLTIMALVGTTVVPYNLFLHAALVNEKWEGPSQLKAARTDLFVSVILGGLVSMAIIVAAASLPGKNIQSAADMAQSLTPIFGSVAKYLLSIGLFAAGITSAITAPLAAAYVASDCFGKERNLKAPLFRGVWMSVLFVGVFFASVGMNAIEIIKFAQIANGLLLPIIALFLLLMVNRSSVLGKFKNGSLQNTLGIGIVLLSILLGLRILNTVFHLI
ncbi:Nramp family divalent metal transporter [Altibacter sp. HG106]|uniref:Nramp family divalent metal transporter n=1 Tax=Altibacter sp. HG106 TaxID=3023937 RepID=UPI002350D652|nr:Nramp family divalent metal transporter [Altibacter sp. HG106]MDC7995427.1 Nramp family divalent metal transporter [Altibacter sp. HG106]